MAHPNNEKLAVLIDADNPQLSVIHELLADASLRHDQHQARLWRLDHAKPEGLEGRAARAGHSAHAAVQLHHGEELDGFVPHHRRDGFAALGPPWMASAWSPRTATSHAWRRAFERPAWSSMALVNKTPAAFVAACDKFVYTEILRPGQTSEGEEEQPPEPLEPILRSAVTVTARENG